MFSIICVFNDEKTLKLNLLQSLNLQKSSFELILVDNRVPRPLTQTLNGAALEARGEFLMFVHQDVKLIDENWLGKAERFLGSLKDLGAAGVAGIDHKGHPRGFIVDRGKVWGRPIKLPMEVMTLDEQLLITPTSLFEHLKFDEGFRFHSYVADYCLRAYLMGLKTYVLPLSVHHNSSTAPILNIGRLEGDDLRLALKHKDSFAVIHKTTGTVSLRPSGLYLINTWKNALRRALNKVGVVVLNLLVGSFQNVLDVGTVPITQPFLLNFLPRLAHSYSVGVSEDVCFIHASKRIKTHKDYVLCSLTRLPFRPKAFDLCVIWSLLEYLYKNKGKKLLKNAEEVGRSVLVRCPNNGAPLNEAYCLYFSKYSVKELKAEGFIILGKGSQLRKAGPFSAIFAAFLPHISVELIGLGRKK